jgi:UDP-galactopyranose mutase
MTDPSAGPRPGRPPAAGPAQSPRPLLLCLSHLRWAFVFQRPQHLLTRAAQGHDVLYVEEPLFEAGATPRLDIADSDGVRVVTPRLPEGLNDVDRDAALQRLLDTLLTQLGGQGPDILWYYTPMALAFSRHLDAAVTVYDNMDELSLFHGADSRIAQLETELMERADLVFTGGQSLFEAKRDRHPNIHPVPSSVDVAHFRPTPGVPSAEPQDLAPIRGPRVGFFGVIDERMDLDLLEAVARLRPDLSFVMIGPVAKIDPAALPRPANIHWLGARAYAELPAYLHHWDVGLMPFARNESTRFISPTKTPEFLAAGLPVVSTPIRDVVEPYGTLGLVEIAATPAEVAAAIDRAMAAPISPGWRDRVARQLARGSWDRTWAFMAARIELARAAAAPAPRKETASHG